MKGQARGFLKFLALSVLLAAAAVALHIAITVVVTDWADYETDWDAEARFRWFRTTWFIALALVSPFLIALVVKRLRRQGRSWIWCLPFSVAVLGGSYFDPPAPPNVTSEQGLIGTALWIIAILFLVALSFWPSANYLRS